MSEFFPSEPNFLPPRLKWLRNPEPVLTLATNLTFLISIFQCLVFRPSSECLIHEWPKWRRQSTRLIHKPRLWISHWWENNKETLGTWQQGSRRWGWTGQPLQAYLLHAHLYVIHGLWALLALCAITVGSQLSGHHLSVSHHQDTHWLPWTHLWRCWVLAYTGPLRIASHLYCGHTNVKIFGAPFYYRLGCRGVEESCSLWSGRGDLPAVVPQSFTGADCLGDRLLRTRALLPDIWLFQTQCSGQQLLLPCLEVLGVQFMLFGSWIIFVALTAVVIRGFRPRSSQLWKVQ